MIDKYYTPKLAEFHVGFEYEAKEESGKLIPGAEVKVEWIPTVFTLNEYGDYLGWENEQYFTDHLEHGNFRVKYLDRNDVESLGFSSKPNGYEHGLVGRGEFARVDENEIIIIRTHWDYAPIERENIVRIFKGAKYQFPYTEIFRGNIKNKSELQKLLVQLQVL